MTPGLRAAQLGPGRREPHHVGRRGRRRRCVLLPDLVRAGRVGLLAAPDRSVVPAVHRRDAGGHRRRHQARVARRAASAADRRSRAQRWWPVLAVPADLTRYVHGRAARACADHRGRTGPDVPAAVAGIAGWRRRSGLGGRRQPAQYRPSGRRLHRPRGAGRRGLDGGGPPRPPGRGGPGGLARAAQVGSGLPVRADGRLRPGLPGRRRDLRAHARSRRHRGPRPPRRPGRLRGPGPAGTSRFARWPRRPRECRAGSGRRGAGPRRYAG